MRTILIIKSCISSLSIFYKSLDFLLSLSILLMTLLGNTFEGARKYPVFHTNLLENASMNARLNTVAATVLAATSFVSFAEVSPDGREYFVTGLDTNLMAVQGTLTQSVTGFNNSCGPTSSFSLHTKSRQMRKVAPGTIRQIPAISTR